MTSKSLQTDKMMAFTFGVIFITVIVGMAVWKPHPSAFEYTVFRVVLALAAAGIGAVLPGFIAINLPSSIRAGGALAVFLIVYKISPVAMTEIIDPPPPPPSGDAIIVAENWLSLIDQGQFDKAYDETSAVFRSNFKKNAMKALLLDQRNTLGTTKERRFVADQSAVNPPGAPSGTYRTASFATTYSGFDQPVYEAINLRGEDGEWKVNGFYAGIKTEAGLFVPLDLKSTNKAAVSVP